MDKGLTERHLKQNKEIIRVNQIQSNRIAALETEITKLLSENIQLRTQVIQLSHRHDISAQKTQLERKIREIHRIVKSLGSPSLLSQSSPAPAIIKKSPKKSNLLNLSPEQSPERSAGDHANARSRTTSLYGGASRVIATAEPVAGSLALVNDAQSLTLKRPLMSEPAGLKQAVTKESPVSTEAATLREQLREEREMDRERDKERQARRSSRRISRSLDELVPLQSSRTSTQRDYRSETTATGSPRREGRETTPVEVAGDRSSRRRSRALNTLGTTSLLTASMLETGTPTGKMKQTGSPANRNSRSEEEEDKENDHAQRRSTASIKFMHSSPIKSRAALNLIADPLPLNSNIPVMPTTTAKALNEVTEVKSEPSSPSLEFGLRQRPDRTNMQRAAEAEEAEEEEEAAAAVGGRSRRAKTVNYAEPSLRHKMRRTESLPGDKRRKSSYRRSSSSLVASEEHGRSNNRSTITIDED